MKIILQFIISMIHLIAFSPVIGLMFIISLYHWSLKPMFFIFEILFNSLNACFTYDSDDEDAEYDDKA